MKLKNVLKDIIIRKLDATDDIGELTELLQLAYKKLSDQGFRFLATHQDVETTKERIKNAECYVVVFKNKIIGTITYHSPENTFGNNWYDQDTVSTYGQLAVNPEFQKQGIGSRLIEFTEKLAKRDKAAELTIDTAENAAELIGYYKKRGYRFVGFAQWEMTNYKSVMLSKKII
jgi:GNAT superfamily N-acetyltransferase